MKKIGFFGGAFNPPTNAHIELAKKAISECKLDKVVFMPMGDWYEKAGMASAKDRYNMLKLISSDNLEVSDLEIRQNQKMHAIDAFRMIDKVYPDVDRYFIMGADNFVSILEWKESTELIKNYKYIVFERKDIDLKKYIDENEEIRNHKQSITIIKNETHINFSSSRFRNCINKEAANECKIIPREVYNYIITNDLYKMD